MAIKVIAPPATEPLSLSEAKLHLRVDGSTDDALITALIKSAREFCEDYQGKKFITQTLELVLDNFPSREFIEFKACSPVQSVTSVIYTDSDGLEKTLDPEEYIVDTDSFINKIALGYGKTWPATTLQPINGIRIRFIAGYGIANDVPESVKWAMVLHMRTLYDDCDVNETKKLESARNALLGMRRVIPV